MSEEAPLTPGPQTGSSLEDDQPLGVPQMVRPAGASEWSSGQPKSLDEILPDASSPEYSAPSQAAIKAINEGLSNPKCTQLDGYGPSKFSAQFEGSNHLISGVAFANEEEYVRWLKELVDNSGAVTTWDKISEDGMGVLELAGGERLCIFLPPLARRSPTFSLRKHTAVQWTPEHFTELGTLDERMLHFLQRCVAAHVNILFVGQMGSGKTSLMRSLVQSSVGDEEKIAIVEQVPELSINKPLVTEYIYQPTVEGYGLSEVLDFNLYNGLSRLIVGEVHMEGLTKMLETMILTEGSMSTYHAFSTEQAGERMKVAMQLEHGNITDVTASSYIRQAIELVVVQEKIGDARRVTQISEIDWRTSAGSSQLSGADLFVYNGREDRFMAVSRPDENGRIVAKLAKYGIKVPDHWFHEPEDLKAFAPR